MTRVVVTRPASEAAQWQTALQAQGHEVLCLPLIRIEAPADLGALDAARVAAAQADALMFVSAQAATHFLTPACVSRLGPQVRCWAPGPGTARALRALGIPAEQIDSPAADAGQFDSESLWAAVSGQVKAGHRLMVVRGQTMSGTAEVPLPKGNGRDWLAQQCQAKGGEVAWCVAYRRLLPAWDATQREQARLAASDTRVWLFSSSEAVTNLHALLPAQDWRHATALVTHPRIAQAVRQLGFRDIKTTRPALADVLHTLESMN